MLIAYIATLDLGPGIEQVPLLAPVFTPLLAPVATCTYIVRVSIDHKVRLGTGDNINLIPVKSP